MWAGSLEGGHLGPQEGERRQNPVWAMEAVTRTCKENGPHKDPNIATGGIELCETWSLIHLRGIEDSVVQVSIRHKQELCTKPHYMYFNPEYSDNKLK
jgi:hypothetical protein